MVSLTQTVVQAFVPFPSPYHLNLQQDCGSLKGREGSHSFSWVLCRRQGYTSIIWMMQEQEMKKTWLPGGTLEVYRLLENHCSLWRDDPEQKRREQGHINSVATMCTCPGYPAGGGETMWTEAPIITALLDQDVVH
ncbi:uncharacterized protein LOC143667378 [Tamandua tetradactyla]|uniref:uncharacterized protein LOC143667378 n=1 Tax=Tamandua tetradactyla TaxID=48850 RepID=UPI0040539F24